MAVSEALSWIGFNAAVLFLLAVDLAIVGRKDHTIQIKEALLWSAFWIVLSLCFNGLIFYWKGKDAALEFLTGYLIEKSLSVDNIFVFLVIFTYFKVSEQYQHRVLFLGIIGALIMRAIFIFTGVALLKKFHWLVYCLGAFLIYTGWRLAVGKRKEIDPGKNPVLRFSRKLFPVTEEYQGHSFFVIKEGRRLATPLFVVLLVIESTDLVFAIDSIPAILAVTRNPFIVYTSNVCAILGLRALYFALAGVMQLFSYLHYGLAAILIFVGIKMLLSAIYHFPVIGALGVVALILISTILLSIFFPPEKKVK